MTIIGPDSRSISDTAHRLGPHRRHRWVRGIGCSTGLFQRASHWLRNPVGIRLCRVFRGAHRHWLLSGVPVDSASPNDENAAVDPLIEAALPPVRLDLANTIGLAFAVRDEHWSDHPEQRTAMLVGDEGGGISIFVMAGEPAPGSDRSHSRPGPRMGD